MKIYILILFLVVNVIVLNAKEFVKINITPICNNYTTEKYKITINSNKLNLTEDAVQDNVGGYVDIPEDRYYFKTNSNVYPLKGIVEKNYKENINQFTSYIYNNSKEFNSLKNSKNLKFVQRINIENNNYKDNIITNILYINFNKNYQQCEE